MGRRRDSDPTAGCGCALVALIAWLTAAAAIAEWIAGPDAPAWLSYDIAGAPGLFFVRLLSPFGRWRGP